MRHRHDPSPERSFILAALAAFALVAALDARPALAFTQTGFSVGFANGIPMGHEWLVRSAAIELLGYPPVVPDVPDPNDPRRGWGSQGRAKNLDLSGAMAEVARIKGVPWNDQRYASRYKAVYDVIVGQRWVDIAGYNAVTSYVCWDSVAQEAVEVQYDHFMRRYDDRDEDGGVRAATGSRERFVQYFVAAAMAPPTTINVYDGGVTASESVDVDRNYFLFGRAAHLFQDSFSSEHTVRIPTDNYERVRQVTSYMCAADSEQHTHSIPILDYTSGDVIWNPRTQLQNGWVGYKPSNMKPIALVALEATKDLWAAFIRTMSTPMAQRELYARGEATRLRDDWLGFDEAELRAWYRAPGNRGRTYVRSTSEDPQGADVKRCMRDLKLGTEDPAVRARQIAEAQRVCVYNAVPWTGYSDLHDPSMHMWYAWRWRNGPLMVQPPDGWKIPNLPADSGTRVQIKSAGEPGVHQRSRRRGRPISARVRPQRGAPGLHPGRHVQGRQRGRERGRRLPRGERAPALPQLPSRRPGAALQPGGARADQLEDGAHPRRRRMVDDELVLPAIPLAVGGQDAMAQPSG